MKKQLIELADKIGFDSEEYTPHDFLHHEVDKELELLYYLWMCEMQKWLRDSGECNVVVICMGSKWGCSVATVTVSIDDLIDYCNDEEINESAYEIALEQGLLRACKRLTK